MIPTGVFAICAVIAKFLAELDELCRPGSVVRQDEIAGLRVSDLFAGAVAPDAQRRHFDEWLCHNLPSFLERVNTSLQELRFYEKETQRLRVFVYELSKKR